MGSSHSQLIDDLDIDDIICCGAMGLSSSTSNPKGRRVLTNKLETAGKTGVLNLADMVGMRIDCKSCIFTSLVINGPHCLVIIFVGSETQLIFVA